MAYKKGKGKMARFRKIEPAVQTLTFEFSVPAGGAVTDYTLDLSQCASLVNRRFYRQGINWAVSGFKMLTSSQLGSIAIKKLPNTWVMSNAWEKGFRNWQQMNDEALEDNESVKPRFLDFKIYADSAHHAAGYAGNLLPGVLNPTFGAATAGEWESSKVAIPTSGATGNATDFELVAVGANYPGASPITTLDAVSLIEGYAASRGLPNVLDPNAPSDADDVGPTGTPENWIGALKNEGTDQDKDILDRMVGNAAENNIAPYPFENDGVNPDTMYPGGANQLTGLQTHDFEFISGTTVGGTTRMKGGMFPCGLVRLVAQNNDPASTMSIIMQVDLVPGSHRGYLCEPMTDM
jgi:hypothetical protein